MGSRISYLISLLGLILSFGLAGCSEDSTGPGGSGPITPEPPYFQILISEPTYLPTFSTTSLNLSISGIVSSSNAVSSVTWSVSGGAAGVVTGTEEWSAAVPLSALDNTIVVTAQDNQGNFASDTLIVTYNENLTFLNLETLEPDFIYTGQTDSVRIAYGICFDSTLVSDSVRLVRVDNSGSVVEVLSQMEDNGDTDNGDAGILDGIFSTIQPFAVSDPQTLNLRVLAYTDQAGSLQAAYSPVFTIPAIEPAPLAEIQNVLDTQDECWAAYTNFLLSHSQSEAVQLTLDWLGAQPEIAEAGFDEELNLIWVQYTLGLHATIHLDSTEVTANGKANFSTESLQNAQDPFVPSLTPLDGSSTSAEIRTNSVLIYEPFTPFGFDEGGEIQALFLNPTLPIKFAVDRYTGQVCDVNMIGQKFGSYGVIYIISLFDVNKLNQYGFCTRQVATTAYMYDHWDDFNGPEGKLSLCRIFGIEYISVFPNYFDNISLPSRCMIFGAFGYSIKDWAWPLATNPRGSLAFLGFDNMIAPIDAAYRAEALFYPMIDDFKNLGDAWEVQSPTNVYEFHAKGNYYTHFQQGLLNGDFETGQLTPWQLTGGGQVASEWELAEPYEGNYMAVIFSDIPSSYTLPFMVSAIEQSLKVPSSADSLTFFFRYCDAYRDDYPRNPPSMFTTFTMKINDNTKYQMKYMDPSVTWDYYWLPVPGQTGWMVDCCPWLSVKLDMTQYRNLLVTARYEINAPSPESEPSWVLLDNIKLWL